jgi:hypothetical protein
MDDPLIVAKKLKTKMQKPPSLIIDIQTPMENDLKTYTEDSNGQWSQLLDSTKVKKWV